MINIIKRHGNLSAEDARIRQAIILISGISVIANAVLAVVTFAGSRDQALVYTTSGISFLIVLVITLAGFVQITRVLIPLIALAGVGYLNIIGNGLHDPIMIAYGGVAIVAALMLGEPGTIAFGFLSMLVILGIGLAGRAGFLPHPPATPTELMTAPVAVFGVSMLLWVVIRQLNQSLRTSLINEQAQIQANTELTELKNSLEQRVEERTVELEIANAHNQKRAAQFEAVAQVARAIATIQDLDTLLPRVTQLISEQFGFYHAGIFFLDENRDYAVLSAANSEGGQRMLAREHKLKVGQTGIVGYVAAAGVPRIALDVGSDAVYFDNPDLPGTHSEMALPLRAGREIAGVLDVQSVEPNAFKHEDVEVLSTLADQVSIAIQNARSFVEAQKLLAEAQSAVSGYITDSWKVLQPQKQAIGYEKTGSSIKELKQPLDGEHIRRAIENDETVVLPPCLAVPIRLRGQIIGVMNIQVSQGHQWNTDEVDIVEAVAERLSLAIETATLLQASQHRANIERVTADISGRIGLSTRLDTILQTAAQELSRALGGSDVLVQIEPIAMKPNASS